MPSSSDSFLTPVGYQPGDCGYCKGEDTSQRTPKSRGSYYVTTKGLGVYAYQDMIDRGWRRSGTLLYKPDVYRSCCPHYTIRLPAATLATRRDQRQALNRWNHFVLGDGYVKETAKRFPKTKEEKTREKNGFDLVHAVHECESSQLKPVETAHRFDVSLEPDDCTQEKFELYKNYQVHVHHDKPGEKDGKEQLLGSYHQCYRLDGRLIAVGVLDLLPHAVSGVYFIYHHDFEKWSFGKLSALREAALALEGGYEYYYMGFYIHQCVKMRYKGDYKPQFVLDPETHDWSPLEGELRALLDRQKYVSLSREQRKKRDAPPYEFETLASTTPSAADREPLYRIEKPVDVMTSDSSLFELGMPGLMGSKEVEAQVDLDRIRLRISKGLIVHTEDLVSWADDSILNAHSLKGVVAEFVACVGPDVAKRVVVDFSRD